MQAQYERSYFYDRRHAYLFSIETASIMKQGGASWVLTDLDSTTTSVFHVQNENTVVGHDAIRGQVWLSQESWRFRGGRRTDVAHCDGRFTIAVGDRQSGISDNDRPIVDCFVGGLVRLDEIGHADLVASTLADRFIEARIHLSMRFETPYPQYRWLMTLQCIGFGKAVISGRGPDFNVQKRIDVYAAEST
jgi:hypothetical protein